MSLRDEVLKLVDAGASADKDAARAMFAKLRAALSAGEVRAAEPEPGSPIGWRVNAWVKQGILLGFRFGDTTDVSMDHGKWPFFDKDTLPMKKYPRERTCASCRADRRFATAPTSRPG